MGVKSSTLFYLWKIVKKLVQNYCLPLTNSCKEQKISRNGINKIMLDFQDGTIFLDLRIK